MSVEYPEPERSYVQDLPYQVNVKEHEWITLADGTKLAARIWFPQGHSTERFPTILEYLPYRKNDGTRVRDEPMHGYFAGHGYVVVRVDIRGSGDSDGLLQDEYLKQEQDDALEVIEWIAAQPFSDGNVGMMGKSWGGFNSLQVAARRPPALKAIIVVGFTDDRYNNDIHYKGGCLLNDNFWWGSIMLAYQVRPPDPAIVGENWRETWLNRLENMPVWMAQWLRHQTRDEYWKHGSVGEDYSAIQIPVLAVDGWADAYTNTVCSLLGGLDVPRRGIIGPWAHVYAHDGVPGPALGFLQEGLAWWDHWLKGLDNGATDGPMIQAWLEDSMAPSTQRPISDGHWVGIDSWPSSDVNASVHRLTPGKMLEQGDVDEHTVQLRTPQGHGQWAGEWMGAGVLGESPADQRADDGMAMVFDSEILDEPVALFGFPSVTVDLRSDTPSAMLFAQLSDVAPDGAVERISYGVMNLTHLQGHDKVVPLVPGETVTATVNLDCCGHTVAAGHRLRVSLATTFWPMFWPMPEAATLELDLGAAEVRLPVFTGQPDAGPNMSPESAPATPSTILTPGRVDRTVTHDLVNDTWTSVTDGVGGVFGEGIYRLDEIDVTVEHNLRRELTISNSDPLSAHYLIAQTMRIGRDGWMIDADIRTTQSSTAEEFIITVDMDITENDEPAFTRSWTERVPRNGL